MSGNIPNAAAPGNPMAADPRGAQAMMRYDANKKSVGVAYLLWFFFSYIGGHRFYLKRTGSAIAMLLIFVASAVLTIVVVGYLGLFVIGIWALVDAFLIPGMARDYNNRLITDLSI
jgi:TM2 domain-containing membrane protein YozV